MPAKKKKASDLRKLDLSVEIDFKPINDADHVFGSMPEELYQEDMFPKGGADALDLDDLQQALGEYSGAWEELNNALYRVRDALESLHVRED
jgi:hypothetical protein